jgi:hypothetical protein
LTFLFQEEEAAAAAAVKALFFFFGFFQKILPAHSKMTELKNGRGKIEMNREEARQEADVSASSSPII